MGASVSNVYVQTYERTVRHHGAASGVQHPGAAPGIGRILDEGAVRHHWAAVLTVHRAITSISTEGAIRYRWIATLYAVYSRSQ